MFFYLSLVLEVEVETEPASLLFYYNFYKTIIILTVTVNTKRIR